MFQQLRLKAKCGGNKKKSLPFRAGSLLAPLRICRSSFSIFIAHSLSFCGVVLYPAAFAFKFGCARFLYADWRKD